VACFPASKPAVAIWLWLCCFAGTSLAATAATAGLPTLDDEQLRWLGERIFLNECNAKPDCLTAWNQGEDFPSLGIGHFIWLRQGQTVPFVETFPGLLDYLRQHAVELPPWLATARGQPWPDRQSFLADRGGPRLAELRTLLARTRPLQTAYIVQRFERLTQDQSGPLAGNPVRQRKLAAVAAAKIPYGLYALIDYVHFKGDGSQASERYQNQGWGLVQVLDGMPESGTDPLRDFVVSAGTVLQQRVANAPVERHEERWLAGWLKRLQTYLPR